MASIGERIRELRLKKGLTQKYIADHLGMGRSNFGHIENDRVTPTSDDLEKIADILNTNTDYILGRTDDPTPTNAKNLPSLTAKDERDIARDLERMLKDLESKESLAFNGEPVEMDEETRELLRISLEGSLRLAKQIAKQKFTPKKHRK